MSSTKSVLGLEIKAIAELVAKGELSAEEVTRASLDAIEKGNANVGAFLTVQAEEALDAARAVDQKRARGETLGPLAGVPVGIKDALSTRNAPTTAGSRILTRRAAPGEAAADPSRGYRPPFDATVVARLRNADAVLVGKCNLDEFAMGSSTENSAFFPTKNPWDETRTPGGSSGGSAAAVASGMVPVSLGSDTGGSIRQPASMTGTVGFKPTYGRVSRYGLVAFASSLDQIGPFGLDVRSAARVLSVIAGRDPRDATTLDAPVEDFEAACGKSIRGLRIGVPDEYFAQGLEPRVEALVRSAITGLEGLGATVQRVSLPHTAYAVAAYYVVATAEASSNLARFDGTRFGLRVEGAKRGVGQQADLAAMYAETRGQGFGREVKRRIMLGTYVLSAGYYDAYYLRAQKVRTLIRRDFDQAFANVDVIATPVAPTPAFRLGEKVEDPLAMYLADVDTLPASMAGLPAVAVPCGLTEPSAGAPPLPVGLQLIGPSLGESRLVAVAHAWEQISPVKAARCPGFLA